MPAEHALAQANLVVVLESLTQAFANQRDVTEAADATSARDAAERRLASWKSSLAPAGPAPRASKNRPKTGPAGPAQPLNPPLERYPGDVGSTYSRAGGGRNQIIWPSLSRLYLGEALARRGQRVLVVDADPQGTLLEWEAAAADLGDPLRATVEGPPSAVMVRRRLAELATRHQTTIVDCPNRDVGIIEAALELANEVIVPMPPGVEELRRGRSALALAERPGASCRVLLTLVDMRMALSQDVIEVLNTEGVARFRSMIRRRAAIAATVGAARPQALHDYTYVADELEASVGVS